MAVAEVTISVVEYEALKHVVEAAQGLMDYVNTEPDEFNIYKADDLEAALARLNEGSP